MSTLLTIISGFSEEEKQAFLALQRRKNRRSDTKNEKLFKLIEAGNTTALDIKLYGKPAKNAYHALCKRLQDSLIDFKATKSFAEETSEEHEILKLILASRIFFEQGHIKIGFKTLAKAERIALETDVYSLLNEIYHTKIQYAHLDSSINLNDLISVSEQNMKLYQQEFLLNQAYARIKLELKYGNYLNASDAIDQALNKFHIAANETLTYKSLFQLMEITESAARLQSDYHSISPKMISLYEIVTKKTKDKNKHRYYHLNILNLMALTHFRNKRFDKSLAVAKNMYSEMNANNKAYYRQFKEKHTVILALNLNFTGKYEKAISILKEQTDESLNIELITIMCLFQQGNFEEAYQNLKKLSHSDGWYDKKMRWVWVVKKNILEILLLIELDKYDLVQLRLQRFKRKFSKKLKLIEEKRVLTFISLVEKYYEDPTIANSDTFASEIENSFYWFGREQEDIFVMSFYAWLKAKMLNTNLYNTTLDLVGQALPVKENTRR